MCRQNQRTFYLDVELSEKLEANIIAMHKSIDHTDMLIANTTLAKASTARTVSVSGLLLPDF